MDVTLSSDDNESSSEKLHSSLSSTASEEDSDDLAVQLLKAGYSRDVVQDYSSAGKLKSLPRSSRRIPNIHRGPQYTSIHTRFQEGPSQYKIVFTYKHKPTDYRIVLQTLTNALVHYDGVQMCKVFTNATLTNRLAFVYINEITITNLLNIVKVIQETFDNPTFIDLRHWYTGSKILMKFT